MTPASMGEGFLGGAALFAELADGFAEGGLGLVGASHWFRHAVKHRWLCASLHTPLAVNH